MRSFTTFLTAAGAAFAVGGCGNGGKPVTMADSFDLDIFGAHVDDLHTPYVAGAQFNITVSPQSEPNTPAGWTLSSSDPNVIRVTSPLTGGSASITAGSPGQATLTVLSAQGEVLDTHVVTVAIPTQVNLYAEGLLLTGADDSASQITEASIVVGGEATFLARYFADGTELYGNGALTSTSTAGLTSSTVSSSFADARDFLHVSVPSEGMTGSVALLVGGVTVGQFPVSAVAASQVTHVTLLEQNSLGAQAGTSLVLYAHAVDRTSSTVFGASFGWVSTQDGTGMQTSAPAEDAIGGPSDLFFYTFDSMATETVTASYDGFSPTTVVHAQGGTVGSTAAVGCALAGAPGAAGNPMSVAGLGLALAAVLAARRRRTV